MENLVSQRQQIKQFEREIERKKRDEEEADAVDEEEVKERAVRDFEDVQMGMSLKREGGKGVVAVEEGKRGEKRKFELDEEELMRIAREDRDKAKKALMEEKVVTFCDSGLRAFRWLLQRRGCRIFGYRV